MGRGLGWQPADGDGRTAHDGRTLVRPLDVDPDLVRDLDALEAKAARRAVVTEVVVVRSQERLQALLEGPDEGEQIGLLVLDGLVLHRTTVAGEATVALVGSGDVLTGMRVGSDDCVAHASSWTVCAPARVAVLDASFAHAVARWPSLLAALLRRVSERAESLAFLRSVTRVRQLDLRVLLLLWHLADRWGRVGADGIVLPLPLTQQMLAELAAARRPSVNQALRELAERGLLDARSGGGWTLYGDPPARGRSVGESPPAERAEPAGAARRMSVA
jgi:CRP/FNR family transcriptional regulator, cyclic AMP receptor protein